MDLRLLSYFVAVAEERSVTRAAQRLRIAQPSLSQQMRRLERDVGVTLIDRSVRPLELTAGGRRLLTDAYRLLGLAADSRRALAALGAGSIGEVTLCLPAGGMYELARHALGAMSEEMPKVGVTPVFLPDADQIPAVQHGDADVAVVRDVGMSLPTGLRSWALADEPLLVALPEGHRATRGSHVRLRDLSGEGFITFPRRAGPTIHDQQIQACRDAGFEPRNAVEVDDPLARDLLIVLGRGVSLIGAGAAYRFPGVAYLPVEPTRYVSRAVAVARSGHHPPPLSALVRHLHPAARVQFETNRR